MTPGPAPGADDTPLRSPPLSPDDLRALADLHARCFTRPRPWTAPEIAALLDLPGTFLLRQGDHGFLMGRAIAGEAELLTLAVAPEARRAGLGQALVASFAGRAAGMGAETAFLEVASDNGAARRLYSRAGWVEAGLRRRYYGPATDAVILRLTLRAPQEGG